MGSRRAELPFIGEEKLPAGDLAASGWASCYVDELVAHHHPSSMRDGTHARRVLESRNDLLTTWMRQPARQGFRVLDGEVGVVGTTGQSRAMEGPGVAAFVGTTGQSRPMEALIGAVS